MKTQFKDSQHNLTKKSLNKELKNEQSIFHQNIDIFLENKNKNMKTSYNFHIIFSTFIMFIMQNVSYFCASMPHKHAI
ncbi:hypothetical protein IW16_11765 [Chryseobacterium vrystaatense]|uniref:Uncharacterized protein n=1 Tax=Chryseobacterium vrystaatense TaxID=307480 RepID=A0ABR4UNU3_9FLAO|nr:hypothetical protein IW16_11765 [Chryseobacterium vrystaatense]